jgi:hypothetical protein
MPIKYGELVIRPLKSYGFTLWFVSFPTGEVYQSHDLGMVLERINEYRRPN